MVGATVKAYLQSKGITQTFVANHIGMKGNVLSDRLNDKSELSAQELYKISEVLGVPLETFRPSKGA